MALSPEVKEKLQRRIDELKKRMQYDANDLDYETHLNQVRELQQLMDRNKQGYFYCPMSAAGLTGHAPARDRLPSGTKFARRGACAH